MISRRRNDFDKGKVIQPLSTEKMSKEQNSPLIKKREEFGYLNIPSSPPDLGLPKPEGFQDKFIRKTQQNPFVPIGLGVTTFALVYGLWQLKTGDRAMSQKMMRLRVAAQGFTVLALIGGVFYSAMTTPQKPKG